MGSSTRGRMSALPSLVVRIAWAGGVGRRQTWLRVAFDAEARRHGEKRGKARRDGSLESVEDLFEGDADHGVGGGNGVAGDFLQTVGGEGVGLLAHRDRNARRAEPRRRRTPRVFPVHLVISSLWERITMAMNGGCSRTK